MDFGIGYFPTHDAVGPGAIARLVAGPRPGVAVLRRTHPHPRQPRDARIRAAASCRASTSTRYDLFVALTAAAEATSTLRIGSGICLVVERDPITTAKEVASVDHLSGGRFEFGIGAGWNREEMANHGTDPRTRMRLLRERVEAMKAIWTQDEASYNGEFVNFDRIWSWPKPLQRPHPPVLVGGLGPTVLDRVLAFGDAWFPNYAARGSSNEGRAALARRAPDRLHDHGPAARARRRSSGCTTLGASRVVHWVPSGGLSVVEADLERWEAAIAEFTGEA